jgi:Ribonuclease G/E
MGGPETPPPTVLHIHDSPGESRIALLRGGVLAEYLIHRPAAPDGIGDLHLARVTAKIPAMAGAFLALHDAEAFLPDSDGAAAVTEGDILPVRITRAAQGGKGPRVRADPARDRAAETGPPRLLQRGPSPLAELQAAWPAATLRHAPFDDALEAGIEALADPVAVLEGGLRATISPTPALTAIDLDGAATTAARAAKAATQMAANLAALPALARQIVLRNLSGAVLVDFAGMPTRKRRALAPALEAALAPDRLHPRLAGFSALGFAEISRPRRRPPLHELLASPHGIGLAALRRAAAEAQAAPGRRLALRAAPAVITALRADPAALAALARLTTYPLALRGDPALHRSWTIEDDAA